MADDVGAALAGPFDRYLSQWDKMRRAPVENREGEEWPTATLPKQEHFLPQTSTGQAATDNVKQFLEKIGIMGDVPPATRLGLDAGIHDIDLPSKEEMMKFLMDNEATGPDPAVAPERVPLPRRRPPDAR